MLDIYSYITDALQIQATVSIGRKIGKADARMPEADISSIEDSKPPINTSCSSAEPHLEPRPMKIRKSNIGRLYQINASL